MANLVLCPWTYTLPVAVDCEGEKTTMRAAVIRYGDIVLLNVYVDMSAKYARAHVSQTWKSRKTWKSCNGEAVCYSWENE